ncbi:hypothetical protein JFL55_07165 [Histophilus somni]|uniref:hypothetical protein n=1 Tax=Histophilus somni TaxID=731 RepID=UPI0018EB3D83|nr:hypothetical protein [Histophilus somni]QQF85569.1 hypothetical protein JFL55_07165 [Histophilus somni]
MEISTKQTNLPENLSADDMKKVVIKAEPSTAPIGISNVASGLGLPAPEKDEEEKKKGTAKKTLS